MKRFLPGDLEAFAASLLASLGVPHADARLTAACLVAANLRGVDTHGIRLLPIYVKRLELGVLNPSPNVTALQEGSAFAALDGDDGLGPVVGARAMDRAVELAAAAGVGMVTVRNSNHFGAAAWYAARALARGMVGIAASNGTPALAPWGGRVGFFGANPIALAVPAAQEAPIVFDMAASVSARARIRQFAARGEPIPVGWAVDREGRPTSDAAEALAGALLPVGGPKGYGIVLMLEVLAGLLAGAGPSNCNRDLYGDVSGPQNIGHLFLAVNPAAFLPDGSFSGRVDQLIRDLHDVPPAEGFSRVRLPGEQDQARRQERSREGVALASELVDELTNLGLRVGVPLPQPV